MRRYRATDRDRVWALNDIPNVGNTADPDAPLDLPVPLEAPTNFGDLRDVRHTFIDAGGDFLVVEDDGHIVGMGGIRPRDDGGAEVLRVRVHPATRRRGVGRALMADLERRAAQLGFAALHLDTAANQPEAVAFYRSLGYREVGRETRPEWSWTLVYFAKDIAAGP